MTREIGRPWLLEMCRHITSYSGPLQAVAELGGSASISEIVETVIKREGFSDAQQAVLHNDGPETEIGYRLAWARTYLKGMGLLTNSSRGVWALTDNGTALLTDPSATDDQRSEQILELRARYLTNLRTARKTRLPQDDGEPGDEQLPAQDRSCPDGVACEDGGLGGRAVSACEARGPRPELTPGLGGRARPRCAIVGSPGR